MILYFSNPYEDGPHLEDITGEDFLEAISISEKFSFWGLEDEVIYVSF